MAERLKLTHQEQISNQTKHGNFIIYIRPTDRRKPSKQLPHPVLAKHQRTSADMVLATYGPSSITCTQTRREGAKKSASK